MPGDSLQPVVEKLIAHARRFAGLPVMPAESILPSYDGDIAQLHELREQIYAELAAGARPDEAKVHGAIEDHARIAVSDAAGHAVRLWPWPWPRDRAGEMLAGWRAENRRINWLVANWTAESETTA